MRSEDIKQKIVDKKLSDVVDLDEDKAKNEDLFADLEDDLFSKPIAKPGGAGGSLGDRKTKLPTYGWERNRPSSRTRVSDREILEEKKDGVPTRWNFASKYEADKSISRKEKCDEVIHNGLSKAMRFAGKDAEFHAVTTEELAEIIRDAFTEGAHFRKENV
tara:strand:+ start:673 stop:1155 length:483 start_codon:yes stop_codon:yes gene_type:complete